MSQSKLEKKFIDLWERLHPTLILEHEFKFNSSRRYRADFAHIPSKLLIEIQGGVWVKSKHSSGVGINRDCEKSFLAAKDGYQMIALTADMIDVNHLSDIADIIRLRRRLFKYLSV